MKRILWASLTQLRSNVFRHAVGGDLAANVSIGKEIYESDIVPTLTLHPYHSVWLGDLKAGRDICTVL